MTKMLALTKIVAKTLPDTRRVLFLNPACIHAIELNDSYETVLTTDRAVYIVEETLDDITEAMGGLINVGAEAV